MHQHPLDALALQDVLDTVRKGPDGLLQAKCVAGLREYVVVRLLPAAHSRNWHPWRCLPDLGSDPPDVRR